MRNIGFYSKHYFSAEQFYLLLDCYNFANDYPISLKFKELDEVFDAGFIYSDRDVDEWLPSFELHWKRTSHITDDEWDVWNEVAFGTLTFDKEVFREAFLRHRESVFDYFKDKSNLLVLKMPYEKDAWHRLCEFTGRNKPEKKFPSLNGSYSYTNPWCPDEEWTD